MAAVKHKGKLDDEGIFRPYYPKTYYKHLMGLKNKEVNIIVQEPNVKTTDDQYAYYRAAIIRNSCKNAECFGGWSEEQIHQYFCGEFLSETKILLMDDEAVEVKMIGSTSKAGKKKMSTFIQEVIAWCAEQDIMVQTPEEYHGNETYVIDKRNG